MATNVERIFQCSKCETELDIQSKTLTCLHSLCNICLTKAFKDDGNCHCPECQEIVEIDQLTVSEVLVNYLKRRKIESDVWKCNLCWDKNVTNWCNDCAKFLCDKCNNFHMRLLREKHNLIKVDVNNKDKLRDALRRDLCNIHKKIEDSYCEQCNMCVCDICYKSHLKRSPHCPVLPISLRKDAVMKRKVQGPKLLKEIEDLEINLQERNQKFRMYSKDLEMECDLKCEELWRDYEKSFEQLRARTHELCDELRYLKNEQVKRWRQLMNENKRMLRKLEIWRINLHYLLNKDQKDKDVTCGLQVVETTLAFSRPQLHEKVTEPVRKYELGVKFSNYWLLFLEGLKNEMIGSGSLRYSDNWIQFETEWNLPISNPVRDIISILVSQEDNHIFLVDQSNNSIIEFTESGEFIFECLLSRKREFYPREMVFSSSDILAVNCWLPGEEKLLFLKREAFSPFLTIKTIIDKKKTATFSFSVCQMKKTILICHLLEFQIDLYTEKGDYIKTIYTGKLGGRRYCPRIRADPSTGNFWGVIPKTSEIICFNENGQKLQSLKTIVNISNFSINELGNFCFCNEEGIFSIFPEKKLHEFQKLSEKCPTIFVSNQKVFVCLQIDNKYLIKIFKIRD